jgi:integrase
VEKKLREKPEPFNAFTVKNTKPAPGRIVTLRDGHPKAAGLELRVFPPSKQNPGGAKRWTIRYRVGTGKKQQQRLLTFGDATTIDLTKAREWARDRMLEVANGKDPVVTKKEQRTADTVEEFAKVFMTQYVIGTGGKEQPRRRSWRNYQLMIDRVVLPEWKNRAMKDITERDGLQLINTIAYGPRGKDHKGRPLRPAPIHANRVLALVKKMWRYAKKQLVIDVNVMADLDKPGEEQVRERSLSPAEIRIFWTYTATMPKALRAMWRVRLLTGQRPQQEVARMLWSEVDIDQGWWTIPSSKTKNKRTHRVPLSAPAVELLRELRPETPSADAFVFSPYTRVPEARLGKDFPLADFMPRDLRRTVRTLLAQDQIPDRWAEELANHKVVGVEKNYNHHTYDREKRQAVEHLARRIDAIVNETDGAAILPFVQRA